MDRELCETFLWLDPRALTDYRPPADEVAGLVAIAPAALRALADDEVARAGGVAVAAEADPVPEQVDVTLGQLVPRPPEYYRAIAVAIDAALAERR